MSAAPWIVVLAGGEGKRLHSLTRALYGVDLPKQFAVLAGDRTLLQQTIERALRLTVPERVLVVVSTTREAIARAVGWSSCCTVTASTIATSSRR